MVELFDNAAEIADPVAVAVREAARIDLIDDGVAPPGDIRCLREAHKLAETCCAIDNAPRKHPAILSWPGPPLQFGTPRLGLALPVIERKHGASPRYSAALSPFRLAVLDTELLRLGRLFL